jgi:RNA polymerase sigma-70 factor, ECF subfamily
VIDSSTFQSLRPHLFSVAYRMLSSAAEAEDVVQDAWLRATTAPDDLGSARAWLTTVVTRLCLDRLKAARARREAYVGPWLPEPVPTEAIASAEDVASRRESVTMAFLLLMETLTPAERAAFLLREVFDGDYAEVAEILETTPAAARQLVHRAKERLSAGRPRFHAPPERQQEIVSRFFEAVQAGDVSALQQYLAADVLFNADGGGKVAAARHPIIGADAVGRLMVGLWKKGVASLDPTRQSWHATVSSINGEPALIVYLSGQLNTVFVFSTDADRITAINVIRNPDKLAWLSRTRPPAFNG